MVSREKIISIGMLFQLMIWFVLNPAARDVILYGVASASITLSTVNVLGKGYMTRVPDREQQRRMAIVSVVGQQNS